MRHIITFLIITYRYIYCALIPLFVVARQFHCSCLISIEWNLSARQLHVYYLLTVVTPINQLDRTAFESRSSGSKAHSMPLESRPTGRTSSAQFCSLSEVIIIMKANTMLITCSTSICQRIVNSYISWWICSYDKECSSCLQCSRAVCSDVSTDNTMLVNNFVNELSSHGDKSFQCFHRSGMVILDRNYSLTAVVNILFWGSLTWFIMFVCVSCVCCPHCEHKSSFMTTPIPRTTTADAEENSTRGAIVVIVQRSAVDGGARTSGWWYESTTAALWDTIAFPIIVQSIHCCIEYCPLRPSLYSVSLRICGVQWNSLRLVGSSLKIVLTTRTKVCVLNICLHFIQRAN